MEVVIAAAPTEAMARQIEVLRLAGLEPTVVDLKSFATLRALARQSAGRTPHQKHPDRHQLHGSPERWRSSGDRRQQQR